MPKFTEEQIEMLERVVDLTEDGKGILHVRANVGGSVWGSIEGTVWGYIEGNVDGYVGGYVGGNVVGPILGSAKSVAGRLMTTDGRPAHTRGWWKAPVSLILGLFLGLFAATLGFWLTMVWS